MISSGGANLIIGWKVSSSSSFGSNVRDVMTAVEVMALVGALVV